MAIYNLFDWHDVTQCEIDGAVNAFVASGRKRRRAINVKKGVEIVKQYYSEKFTKPTFFDITSMDLYSVVRLQDC